MKSAKYIVMAREDGAFEQIIVFPFTIAHKTMADAMKTTHFKKCVSAGFIDDLMQCYGESYTLRLKSRPFDDTLLLQTSIEINGLRKLDKNYNAF